MMEYKTAKDRNYLRNEEQKQSDLENCDFCKAVLMLLIVLYHSMVAFRTGQWKGFAGQNKIVVDLLGGWLNTIDVSTFVLISGYIFAYLKIEKNKYNDFGPFLISKIKRLLIPYAFVSIVWLIPADLIAFNYDVNTIINSYVLGTAPSQLWFLLMLFWVFVIMYFMSDLVKSRPVVAFVCILVLWLVTFIANHFFDNYYQIWSIGSYLVIFACGMLIRIYGSTFLRKLPNWVYIVIGLLVFIAYYLTPRTNALLKLFSIGLDYTSKILGSIACFLVLTALANRCKTIDNNRLFVFFKKNSFTIFLFHEQVIYFTLRMFWGKLPVSIHILINAVCALLVSSIMTIILNKFKVTRALIGASR